MKEKATVNDKMIVTALIAGMTAFLALSGAVSTIADELPDISEKVGVQEVYEETSDINTIVLNEVEAPNKIFVGWNTEKDGSGKMYKAGDKLDISKSIAIYPIWEDVKVDISLGDANKTAVAGEDVSFKKSREAVGTDGIEITPESLGLEAKANDGCTTQIAYKGITVNKAVQATDDESVIFPEFENDGDTVNIKPEYEVQVIHNGKIISKSTVGVPMTLSPSGDYFEKEEQKATLVTDEGQEQVDYSEYNLTPEDVDSIVE